MKWLNPNDTLPKQGQYVAVLRQHWKEHKYLSCEISFGEIEWSNSGKECRACTNDFTGFGQWSVYLVWDEENDYAPDDVAIAWMPAEEFTLPEWVPHDKHWDN